ncbi:MAG TPA: TerC family protein [Rhodocyclaceae bacterium]|jgi:YjbE family integral membrane protein
MDFASTTFWIAVFQIIVIDILLSGDNAVVIAMACRNLPAAQRKKGILWGVLGAVVLRVVLTAVAATLLGLPYLKIIGGLLLLWIGVKLLLPEGDEGEDIQGSTRLIGAIKTIIVADFVMSLDNVIGVAAAAHDSLWLLIFGLAVSIPLIVFSSALVLHLMERFPIVVTLGAGLLGYVAGSMMVTDPLLAGLLSADNHWLKELVGGICAVLVVVVGNGLAWRLSRKEDRAVL